MAEKKELQLTPGWEGRLKTMLRSMVAAAVLTAPVQDRLSSAVEQNASKLMQQASQNTDSTRRTVAQKRSQQENPLDALGSVAQDSPVLEGGPSAATPGQTAEGNAMSGLQRAKRAAVAPVGEAGGAELPEEGQQEQEGETETETPEEQEGAQENQEGEESEETADDDTQQEDEQEEGAAAPPEIPEGMQQPEGAPAPQEGGSIDNVNRVDPQTGMSQFEQEKEAAAQEQAGAKAPQVSQVPTNQLGGASPAVGGEQGGSDTAQNDQQKQLQKDKTQAKSKAKKSSTKKKTDALKTAGTGTRASKKAKEKILWGLIGDAAVPTPAALPALGAMMLNGIAPYFGMQQFAVKPTIFQRMCIVGVYIEWFFIVILAATAAFLMIAAQTAPYLALLIGADAVFEFLKDLI